MKSAFYAGTAAATVALLAAPAFAQSRDQIRIVGSSTVFPYTQAVAEQFAGLTGSAAPVVESTGTGGGMQIFCGGVGTDAPRHHRRLAGDDRSPSSRPAPRTASTTSPRC